MNKSVTHAARVEFGVCESCSSIHIEFYDKAGRKFAHGLLALEHIPLVTEHLLAQAERLKARSSNETARPQ